MRQTKAKAIWTDFIAWATKIQDKGVAHESTQKAFAYFLKYQKELQIYLSDPRLSIANILAEHVAKHVAIARKNFLFSSTPSGATASANCFSIIQTAKLHGHQVNQYLAVILSQLPKAKQVQDYEQYLPWNITPEEVKNIYLELPLI